LENTMNVQTAPATTPVSILVTEYASYSSPWLRGVDAGQMSVPSGQVSSDIIVVSQLASELPGAFATRVMHRLGRLDRAVVSRAVLAVGPRADDASLAARARISQFLVASLQGSPAAKLTLAAPPAASDKLRHQLLAIAGTILEQARVPNVGISVQLGDAGSPRRGALTEGAEIARKVA
jgi:hypothetical protein